MKDFLDLPLIVLSDDAYARESERWRLKGYPVERQFSIDQAERDARAMIASLPPSSYDDAYLFPINFVPEDERK